MNIVANIETTGFSFFPLPLLSSLFCFFLSFFLLLSSSFFFFLLSFFFPFPLILSPVRERLAPVKYDEFLQLLGLFSSRVGAIILCGGVTPFVELSGECRMRVFWGMSFLSFLSFSFSYFSFSFFIYLFLFIYLFIF